MAGLSACGGESVGEQSDAGTGQVGASELSAPSDITLENLGGQWSLARISATDEASRDVTGVDMDVDEATGGYIVENGCNNPRGTFDVTGGVLTSSPVMITRMACLDNAVAANEDAIVGVLSEITSATLSEEGQLQIVSQAGVLDFVRQ